MTLHDDINIMCQNERMRVDLVAISIRFAAIELLDHFAPHPDINPELSNEEMNTLLRRSAVRREAVSAIIRDALNAK